MVFASPCQPHGKSLVVADDYFVANVNLIEIFYGVASHDVN
jgi:hypothetical protein